MPYNTHDKYIYNKGYYSGCRYMVLRILSLFHTGYDTPQCFECGSKSRLEIHEINPVDNSKHRNYDNWIDIRTNKILCYDCHSKTEGYRGKYNEQ